MDAATKMRLVFFAVVWLPHLSSQQLQLRQGAVRGTKIYTDTHLAVNAYLGIPYVEPPLGRLRFSSPERSKGWNGTLEAVEMKPACLQPLLAAGGETTMGVTPPSATSEDCLYLNVWTPADNRGGLPVLLLFEGDQFVSGWPGRFPGHELAAEGIVVVTVSYRLNVFGFFYLGVKEARGNYGLLDQYLALLWVRDNAAAFGGDAAAVTLAGHGAGAAAVLLHATSPRANGLFQRVLAMSGSPLAPWAGQQRGAAAVVAGSRRIADAVGCLKQDVAVAMACLRRVSTRDLMHAFQKQYNGGNWSEIPLPVSDSFLPESDRYLNGADWQQALRKISVPVVLGVTANDGLASLAPILSNLSQQGYQQLQQFAEQVTIPSLITQMGIARMRQHFTHQIISHHYVDRARNGDAEALLAQIILMYTDAMYHAPAHTTASLMAENFDSPPVYVYSLGSNPSLPKSDLVFHSGINSSGATYGTDLIILMGQSLLAKALGRRPTVAEDRMASAVRRFWINFIRQGNPTPNAYGYNVLWRRYSPIEGNFFSLENQQMQLEPLPKQGIALWNSLLPKLDALHHNSLDAHSGVPQNIQVGSSGSGSMGTILALGVLSLVLAVLLVSSLVILKRRYGRDRDNAEDAF